MGDCPWYGTEGLVVGGITYDLSEGQFKALSYTSSNLVILMFLDLGSVHYIGPLGFDPKMQYWVGIQRCCK